MSFITRCMLSALLFTAFLAAVPAGASEIPECERCVADPESDYSPFAFEPLPDALLMGAGTALAVIGLAREKSPIFDEWYEHTYNKNDINSLDRIWYNPYSSTLHALGTVTCAINLAVLPVGVFAVESAMGNFFGREWVNIGSMYLETLLLTYGVKNIIKTAVKRPRPYMYTDKRDKGGLESYDYTLSFPSGHSADAFMGASFLSYVFCQYYPDSKFKIPVIGVSYAFAVSTALLRVASGNHFLTDVATGAAIGTVIGLGVPFIHHRLALNKYSRNNVSISPGGVSARLFF